MARAGDPRHVQSGSEPGFKRILDSLHPGDLGAARSGHRSRGAGQPDPRQGGWPLGVSGAWVIARRRTHQETGPARDAGASPMERRRSCGPRVWTWREHRLPGCREDPDAQRGISDIPPEEIANAALHVLKGQVSMPADDLIQQRAGRWGSSAWAEMSERVSEPESILCERRCLRG